MFSKHLGHVMDLARPILDWPEFDVVCRLTLDKVVPRLLLPLQADGRVLKPCLVHGDCWDGNTAMDAKTGDAFVFDVCSFYGHNEYDTGNWRAPRHRLSNKAYIRNYKKNFPVSEPGGSTFFHFQNTAMVLMTFLRGRLGRSKPVVFPYLQHWKHYLHSGVKSAPSVSHQMCFNQLRGTPFSRPLIPGH